MATLKNISPLGDLEVPILGRIVKADESVEISDELVDGFKDQIAIWEVTPSVSKKSNPTTSAAPAETQGE